MDAAGDVLAVHNGPREVAAFRETAQNAQRYLDLKAVADPTPAQKAELFMAELAMGKLDLAAATKRKAELTGLTPEQEDRIAAGLTDLEITEIIEGVQRPQSREEDARIRQELGGKFHAMYQAGKRPQADHTFQPFYMLILDHAEAQKDVATFEAALSAIKERYGNMAQVKPFIAQQQERLERLKQAAAAPR